MTTGQGTSEVLERFWRNTTTQVFDASGETSIETVQAHARGIAKALLGERTHLEGERVAVYAAPGRAFLAALYGVMSAGGVAVILSPLHPEEETAYFLSDASVTRILVDGSAKGVHAHTCLQLDAISPCSRAALPLVQSEAPALQLYTSGTTSRPKGAILLHRNVGVQQALVGEAWGFSPRDTLLHTLPLHHMHGLCIALLTAIGQGAAVRLERFAAEQVWESMARASVFMGVPTMYAKLFEAFDRASEESQSRWKRHAEGLRLATSGSAALPVPLAERWHALTGTIPLERFGMTEIGVGISNPLHGERVAGSVGFPLPTVDVRIVDDAGNLSEEGALLIRGPSVFAGYHRREGSPCDSEGWFHTGDTVRREPSGRIRILGRSSIDILKSGGYKISALEIEDALRRLPGITDAAVVGMPDAVWGERVVACITSETKDAAPSSDAVRTALRNHLAVYKIPKDIVFIDQFPRNPMGKVVKPELIKMLSR